MTPDEQEALSRAHSNDVIYILPLRSGNIAVFNRARQLCGIVANYDEITAELTTYEAIRGVWHPPLLPAQRSHPTPTLEDLGL